MVLGVLNARTGALLCDCFCSHTFIFLNLFVVCFEPPLRLRFHSAGDNREGLPIRVAVGHLVHLAPLEVTIYTLHHSQQDKSL